jgi:hypothetical protein
VCVCVCVCVCVANGNGYASKVTISGLGWNVEV